jgi:hypothetical protein
VEETVLALLRQYNAFHELKGRNLTCDRWDHSSYTFYFRIFCFWSRPRILIHLVLIQSKQGVSRFENFLGYCIDDFFLSGSTLLLIWRTLSWRSLTWLILALSTRTVR